MRYPEWTSPDGRIRLINADCLLVRDSLPPVDVIIADPPYGIKFVKGSSGGQGAYRGSVGDARLSRHKDAIIGDDQPFDPAPWLAFDNVLLWGANHFCKRLPDYGRWLAWNKLEHLESFDSFSDVEFAWHSKGKASRVCNYMWKGGLACRKSGENNGRRCHPTQKPVGLLKWCIEQSQVPVDGLVCDPYAGSGTTAVACVRSGRRCIAIERDPEHFQTAIARLKAEYARTSLFDGACA
jgi:site-specific DNA-methyltransferase (adenine-specific)